MLCYTHMMTGFCFIAIPFIHYYKTKYLILGNEQDMDFTFTNKDGRFSFQNNPEGSLIIEIVDRGFLQTASQPRLLAW